MALIHHVVNGAGSPPLVFVHGFACSHTDWQAQVEHFSARHMTVAVDLPGHGATPAPPGPAASRSAAPRWRNCCAPDSLPPAVLVGHSMGCRVVLDAALRAPGQVAGVVLVDGSRFAAAAIQAFEARFAAGEYRQLVNGLFEQMFTERSDAKVVADAARRALALPEDVGRAMLISMVRYDIESLELGARAPASAAAYPAIHLRQRAA